MNDGNTIIICGISFKTSPMDRKTIEGSALIKEVHIAIVYIYTCLHRLLPWNGSLKGLLTSGCIKEVATLNSRCSS